MIARRSLIVASAAVVSACGFTPLYAPGGAQDAGLASVYVDIIPNRSGQLIRQALQARLYGDDSAMAKRFTLSVGYNDSLTALGTQADNSTTRNRDVGTAVWTLYSVDNPTDKLASGTVRSVDGYNTIDEQFFYSDLEYDGTQKRIAEALADQIVTGLSLYFRKQQKG